MKKTRDLLVILVIYLFAFVLGYFAAQHVSGLIARYFAFDIIATLVVFVFSLIFKNSSVYDAYWSAAPLVMALCLFVTQKAGSPMQLCFLTVFLLWAVRLTVNWVTVFTDFSYEDWRYRKYRDETSALLWPFVNFFGIHLMPTLVVFAGMLPLFELAAQPLDWRVIPGVCVMGFGIALEFFADRQMHAFLEDGQNRGKVIDVGLWRYSRHPNYLGEISFWFGVFFAMLPFAPGRWYYGVGAVSVALLFNVVSIPLMEQRQLARREEYGQYCETTSRLLLKPRK